MNLNECRERVILLEAIEKIIKKVKNLSLPTSFETEKLQEIGRSIELLLDISLTRFKELERTEFEKRKKEKPLGMIAYEAFCKRTLSPYDPYPPAWNRIADALEKEIQKRLTK